MAEDFFEIHVIFKGHVQGVGFRASTAKFANSLDLKGTVCNLSDGSVEMRVQGSLKTIDCLFQELKLKFAKSIEEIILIEKKKPTSFFTHFSITR